MLLLIPLALADEPTDTTETTEAAPTFPVLDVLVPDDADVAFRELAEAAGPIAFQCLVDNGHRETISLQVGARGGALFIEPDPTEGPVDLCIVRAVLTAERPTLPDGETTFAYQLATP